MNDRSSFPLYCRYQNNTNQFQIVIVNSTSSLERFLSPGMSVEFSAQLDDYVTVKDGCVTTVFADRIPCWELSTSELNTSLN